VHRARALAGLGQVREALATIHALVDDYERHWALTHLLPQIDESLVPEAVTVARGIEDPWERSLALAAMARFLREHGDTKQALDLARQIPDPWPRAIVLAELGRDKDALATARGIKDDRDRGETVAGLAPALGKSRLREALEIARGIEEVPIQAKALAAVALRVAVVDGPSKALEMAESIGVDAHRADVLAGVALGLDRGGLPAAVGLAVPMADGAERSRALAALAPRLEELDAAALRPVWERVLLHSTSRSRAGLLLDLAALHPVIMKLGGQEAVAETCRAIEDVGRWWP
jgi:hypothetical protein